MKITAMWLSECCGAKPQGKVLRFNKSDWDGYCICSECGNKSPATKSASLDAKCACGERLHVFKNGNKFMVFCSALCNCCNKDEGEGKTVQQAVKNFLTINKAVV